MEYLFAFLFGAVVGSFANVCIYRLPRDISLYQPRSRCSFCGQPIVWYDNIPLLSFLALRGKCRSCQSFISFRYPFVEFLVAALFVLCYLRIVAAAPGYPPITDPDFVVRFWFRHPDAVSACVIGCFFLAALVVATFIDLEYQIIPDSITLGGLAAALILSALFPWWHRPADVLLDDVLLAGRIPGLGWLAGLRAALDWIGSEWSPHARGLLSSLLGAAVGSASVWITGFLGKWLFRKEAMGFGDVKFNAMIGALLGWKVAIGTLLLGAVFGAVGGVAVLIRTRQSRMPFGPFLSLAAGLFLLFPQELFLLPEWWSGWVNRMLWE
ncbi:MAG: prepilin peptidase [Planctomycetes bacterium]|nr:prepilin peptidase [Planctomycetota bacterium]